MYQPRGRTGRIAPDSASSVSRTGSRTEGVGSSALQHGQELAVGLWIVGPNCCCAAPSRGHRRNRRPGEVELVPLGGRGILAGRGRRRWVIRWKPAASRWPSWRVPEQEGIGPAGRRNVHGAEAPVARDAVSWRTRILHLPTDTASPMAPQTSSKMDTPTRGRLNDPRPQPCQNAVTARPRTRQPYLLFLFLLYANRTANSPASVNAASSGQKVSPLTFQ